MALKDDAIMKVWKGELNFMDKIKTHSATPNAAINADFMRQLCYNTGGNEWYIHTGATVATQTWTQVA